MAEPAVKARVEGKVSSRWLTLKLLDSDPSLMKELREYLNEDILEVPEISLALSQAREHLAKYGITNEILKDRIVAALVASAEKICRDTVQFHKNGYNEGDLSLIHISEPTRQAEISYAVFCLKKKKEQNNRRTQ